MIKSIFRNTIPAILVAIMYSCSTNTVYHRYLPTDDKGWSREDTLSFVLPDSMKTGMYHTEIGIRHTEAYPYKDIWLSILLPQSDKADTIHIYLANDRGNWNSNGSTGGYFQYSVNATEFSYSPSQNYTIKISHIMNDNPLQGISDIGLKITHL